MGGGGGRVVGRTMGDQRVAGGGRRVNATGGQGGRGRTRLSSATGARQTACPARRRSERPGRTGGDGSARQTAGHD